jgi:putative ABC transport system ATP-binding protein
LPCSVSSMRAPTIEARGISKAFASGATVTRALNDISISLTAGELALIAGPSGGGKSTLLAILSGLMRADCGFVRALGMSLAEQSDAQLERFRLRHTGFVFQGFNLFSALTALEQVLLPLKYLSLPPHEARTRAEQALNEVGLGKRMHSRPSELSGGEKQRVAIARALAKHPTLLFADEPTSALDAATGRSIIDLLRRAAHVHDVTVVCVSHDPRLLAHADRTFHIEDGRILASAREPERMQEAYA